MSAEYCTDANAFVTTWNLSHPIDVFPSLWRQLADHRTDIVVIKPIYDQIDPISLHDIKMTEREKAEKYPLRTWMIDNQFVSDHVDFIESRALELEREYQIRKNSKKGVDEKDLKLIAYAKLYGKTVVTEERKQPENEKPKKKYNYKIPLVCVEQGVKCINFVEMLRRLRIEI